MFLHYLGISRDIAIILLALEFMLLGAVPVYVLLKLTRALRVFIPRVAPWLRMVHGKELRIVHITNRSMSTLRAPFIQAASLRAGVRAFRRSAGRRVSGGR